MKCITSLILAFGLPLAFASSSSISSHVPPSAVSRFLAEQDSLEKELSAWKNSSAGVVAQRHGSIPTASLSIQDSDARHQDQLRRFFLTKLHIEEVQRQNPDAIFSTDSPFTLMSDVEFAKFVGMSFGRHQEAMSTVFRGTATTTASTSPSFPLAADKDWTTSGCVAPVKQQGQCGSCWAFAAVAALESGYCLQGNGLTLFSEQQVTSCDNQSGGCEGGFPGDGLAFIQKQRGICRSDDYPYESGSSGQSGQCQASCSPVPVSIQQVVNVPSTENGLMSAVGGRPVAVGVAAGNRTWKQYKGGVVSTCASSTLDHAVLVVGYGGSSSATPYFKIKNSWGAEWGEGGFIRLRRGTPGAGTCGIIGPKSVYPVL